MMQRGESSRPRVKLWRQYSLISNIYCYSGMSDSGHFDLWSCWLKVL